MRRYNPRQARESVTVTPSTAQGPRGSVPGTPVQVRCRFVLARKLTVAADGTDTVASGLIHASPELNPGVDLDALFTPGTAVTARGVTRRVIGIETAVNRGRLIYVAVTLT